MLRLIYLLLRQRMHVPRAAPIAWARLRPAALVACAALAGAIVFLVFGERLAGPAPEASAERATLVLHATRIERAPLVVYLEGARTPEHATHDPTSSATLTSVGGAFEPAFQTAPLRTRVEVVNADEVAHNTHVFDGRRTLFNVALPHASVPVQRVLARAGVFEVRCDLHPWMRAALFVPPGPHHAVLESAGTVEWRDIAAGRYRLHDWMPGRGKTTRWLQLVPGETRTLEVGPP